MGPQTTPAFPTLDEQLAHRPARSGAAVQRPLVAVFEGAVATPETVAVIPEGTLVATVVGSTPSMPDLEVRATGVQELLATLGSVVGFVRTDDRDALLISDAALLDGRVLAGLEEALANDSACSTVSVDDHSRPFAPGLPPPAIDGPRAGVVLVRRDDIVLATDEAELTGRFMGGTMERAAPGSIVAQLLLAPRPPRLRPSGVRRRRETPGTFRSSTAQASSIGRTASKEFPAR